MGTTFKMWWRSGKHRMPLVQRDIKRFSTMRDPMSGSDGILSDRSYGRLAKSDQVAACLLRREYADALPLRREAMVARNRRRLRVLFAVVLLWWVVGWMTL
jgi:hypothetical protein